MYVLWGVGVSGVGVVWGVCVGVSGGVCACDILHMSDDLVLCVMMELIVHICVCNSSILVHTYV